MNAEDVFSSRIRMKIVKTLVQMGELNVSEIARRLHVNYETAIRHLGILENEGMLQRKIFGRIRLYRLNIQSPKTRAVLSLLDVWEQTERIESKTEKGGPFSQTSN